MSQVVASFFILYSPSTGKSIGAKDSGTGYPYKDEPNNSPPKLFRRQADAKGWLTNWKKGYKVPCHDEWDDNLRDYYTVTENWIPIPHRAESDLQVRQVTLNLI